MGKLPAFLLQQQYMDFIKSQIIAVSVLPTATPDEEKGAVFKTTVC